jgi:hypothetical protein
VGKLFRKGEFMETIADKFRHVIISANEKKVRNVNILNFIDGSFLKITNSNKLMAFPNEGKTNIAHKFVEEAKGPYKSENKMIFSFSDNSKIELSIDKTSGLIKLNEGK